MRETSEALLPTHSFSPSARIDNFLNENLHLQVNHSIHDVINEDMVTWPKIDTLRLRITILKMLFAPLLSRIFKVSFLPLKKGVRRHDFTTV